MNIVSVLTWLWVEHLEALAVGGPYAGRGLCTHTPTYSSGAPEPILRSSGSLKGFRELRKAVILMVMIYYSERIGIKTSQGQGTWGRVQGRPGGSFQLPSPG